MFYLTKLYCMNDAGVWHCAEHLSTLVRSGWGVDHKLGPRDSAAVTFFCRYGERTAPFCVTLLEGQKGDGEFSRRINNAVERASSDYHSGTSSDEEGANSSISSSSSSTHCAPEPKCIPTVSNPNSVYQVLHTTLSNLALEKFLSCLFSLCAPICLLQLSTCC